MPRRVGQKQMTCSIMINTFGISIDTRFSLSCQPQYKPALSDIVEFVSKLCEYEMKQV